ncbi:helix-turn-helix domain-containing protein [Paenibacillus chungangensis]|uniref:Helix-turn-helix domain-containing protein n=1 Tax=Paenibacillus chungangensis TaxID=696535 RepID=A0ABW3HRC3_9BACL
MEKASQGMMEKDWKDVSPDIRVAHHYIFTGIEAERHRYGYCYAFHLVISGQGYVVIHGRKYPVKRGSLFIVPPHTLHSFETDHNQPLATYNMYCELWHAAPDVTIHLYYALKERDERYATAVIPDMPLARVQPVLELQHVPFFTEWFAHMVRAHLQPFPNSGHAVRAMLYAWLMELTSHEAMLRVMDLRIKKILEQIDAHASWELNYAQLLAWSGLKKTQFNDLFKQSTGLSPNQFLIHRKMKQAETLLTETDLTVTDIAEKLGYTTLHHFSKQFTVHFGISPASFRSGRRAPE